MSAFSSIILSLIAGFIGIYIGILCGSIGGGIIACSAISMGACIIYTINKNFEQLRKDIKQTEVKSNKDES